jgi:hypothetical protein
LGTLGAEDKGQGYAAQIQRANNKARYRLDSGLSQLNRRFMLVPYG